MAKVIYSIIMAICVAAGTGIFIHDVFTKVSDSIRAAVVAMPNRN